MINRCFWDKSWRDCYRFWWNLIGVERIEGLGIWGVLIWLISEEKKEGSWVFNFRFLMSCRGMILHAAAWVKNTGLVKGLHAAAWGRHAAACFSREFVWEMSMLRHEETMPWHDSVFLHLIFCSTFARVQTFVFSPEITENLRVMPCMTKILSNLFN